MKYTTVPLILHVDEREIPEDVILGIKGLLNQHYYNCYLAVCEESKWNDSNEMIFNLSAHSALQDSEIQF
jgi:hypothetical protein